VFYGSAGGQSDRNTTAGGGGGGATTAGADATLGGGGNGGEGFESAITGTAVVYGSGGGGGGNNSSGLGGTNGGDATSSNALATSGVTNTGSGGGGSGISLNGSGGSGIVVLRYIAGIQAEAGTPYKIEGIQIGDPDAAGSYTVTFTQTNGVLAVTENVVGGLVTSAIEGNNSDKVTLTGTLVQINATLAASNGLALTMDSGFSGSANLTMTTTDSQGASDTDVVAVTVPEAPSLAGQSVIDLGSYGQLIAPVQVQGKWYYFWDRNDDDTASNVDWTSHDLLDGLFNQDIAGVTNTTVANADGQYGTTDNYRYGTLNGVRVALPTLNGEGGVSADIAAGQGYTELIWPGTAYTDAGATSNGTTGPYGDFIAIWDAYNGAGTGSGNSGLPPQWQSDGPWTATPGGKGHLVGALHSGGVWGGSEDSYSNFYVALQVL
jgi:hypothetical protein